MSPERAKIFFVEDNEHDRSNVQWFLERDGHSIVIEARTLGEALSQIPELQEKGVNVAIVDGNLTEGDGSGEDGEKVTNKIKKLFGESVKVISLSGQRESYGYGDVFVMKNPRDGYKELLRVVREF